jgi:hypothetical protein
MRTATISLVLAASTSAARKKIASRAEIGVAAQAL